MQAKVIIERHTAPHQEHHALAIATELRAAAIRQPGHISGETLIDVEDHTAIVVIGTWRDIEDWKRWESSEERKLLEANMAINLEAPLFMPGVGGLQIEQTFVVTESGCRPLITQNRQQPFMPNSTNPGSST